MTPRSRALALDALDATIFAMATEVAETGKRTQPMQARAKQLREQVDAATSELVATDPTTFAARRHAISEAHFDLDFIEAPTPNGVTSLRLARVVDRHNARRMRPTVARIEQVQARSLSLERSSAAAAAGAEPLLLEAFASQARTLADELERLAEEVAQGSPAWFEELRDAIEETFVRLETVAHAG